MVKPVTVIGDPEPVPVAPPGLAVTVYPVIVEPPAEADAVNETVAEVSPAVAVPIVGALGAIALTVNDLVTVVAALVAELPAWSASIVQVPADTNVRAPPEVMVQTPVVEELKLTVNPELEVALKVGLAP